MGVEYPRNGRMGVEYPGNGRMGVEYPKDKVKMRLECRILKG